ncbi:MAG TPA: hypothetical protein PJ986_11255 [Gammaproteobacteria bacterium]|nr:hypothetical protein [Gammaproteobacteria bacterium]
MKGDEDLQRLEGRLAALGAEQSARAAAVEAACRERLAAPGSLLGAALAGAMLGLLGGGKTSRSRGADAPTPAVSTGGATVLGAIVALAGLAGAAMRILELGVLMKSGRIDAARPPRD